MSDVLCPRCHAHNNGQREACWRCHTPLGSASCYGPLTTVTYVHGEGLMRTEWQVTMQEDGTLMVIASGRRPGRVLAESRSNTTIGITTDRLVIEGHNAEAEQRL